jgi:hypothetical protein
MRMSTRSPLNPCIAFLPAGTRRLASPIVTLPRLEGPCR